MGLRQPGRSGDRRGDLHPGAQPPGRHRVRLHRHAAGRGRLPDRDRHGVRVARPGLAAQTGPAPGHAGADRRRNRPVRVLRVVGAAIPRDPRRAGAGRPGQRRVPVHELAGADRGRRAGTGVAGDVSWASWAASWDVSSEYAAGLWSTVWAAGQAHGLVAGGYRAIESLRLEKGYRVWGSDITPETNPYEAGLGFCVKLDKPGGFEGVDVLREVKRLGPSRRLRAIVLDDPGAGRAGLRAGARRRPGGRPRDVRGIRLHRRCIDRVGLPTGRPGRIRYARLDRPVRRADLRSSRARASLDPKGERVHS